MKKRVDGWGVAAALARGGDHILNAAIALLLIVALLFGGFGLWDTWQLYRNAGVSADILKYKPTSTEPDEPNPSLEELQKINPDVCAWLTVDDTNIDYPVVQGQSNSEYLNLAVDKTFSLSGSIFLDCGNARDFTDFYSLIYGHHMIGGMMFGDLPNFTEKDYFQAHTTGTLALPDRTLYIEWFACLETTAYDGMMFSPTAYTDAEEQSKLLDYVADTATQYRDIGVSVSDQLVALSTCAEAGTDGRVILVGRLY
jgi:sortase B